MSEMPRVAHRQRTFGLLLSIAGLGLFITTFCLWISYIFVLQTSQVAVDIHDKANATAASTVVVQSIETTTVASAAQTPAPTTSDEEQQPGVFILHPEEHVRRDPKTIRLTWNVTQEKRAPDGVLKTVYLINGLLMPKCSRQRKLTNC